MTALTRGPLPAGVYWRRRLAVVGIVLLFVVGVTRLFGGDGGEPRAQDAATNVAASTAPSVTPTASPTAPAPTASAGPTPAPVAPTPTVPTTTAPVLPDPEGRCDDADVVATPAVDDARATTPVVIRLELRTLSSPACTWHFGPTSLQVKITSGNDRIWSSLECPKALAGRDLVVRRDTPTTVGVRWNSRRSDEDCSSHTAWALPGYYHATVAVLGGEPVDVQFPLRKPSASPRPTAPTPTSPATTAPAAPTTAPSDQRRKKRPQPGTPTATVTAPPNVD